MCTVATGTATATVQVSCLDPCRSSCAAETLDSLRLGFAIHNSRRRHRRLRGVLVPGGAALYPVEQPTKTSMFS